MKPGIIICSRLGSERVPGKALKKINGMPSLKHLCDRLKKTGLPMRIAIPNHEAAEYIGSMPEQYYYLSHEVTDPLARMHQCAHYHGFDPVIRVTHDKIFIDPSDIKSALDLYSETNADYLFGNRFIDGTAFEIISFSTLVQAANQFKDVEFISYAVRMFAKNIVNYKSQFKATGINLMIDYPNDVKLMEVVLSQLGNECELRDVIKYLHDRPEIRKINKKPQVTVYTCVFNGERWIERCMESVIRNNNKDMIEYIVIDDASTDRTPEIVATIAAKYPFIKWFRNEKNIGLSSSCNVALKHAEGRYIVRLDADDYFATRTSISELFNAIDGSDCDVIYPANYFGNFNTVQKGNEQHHVGGAIFDKRAINHIKFTDGLRGYEGLDLFVRAREQLKIGYYKKPVFMYSQHDDSMSKTNLKEREKIKKKIMSGMMSVEEMHDDDLSSIL